MTIYLTAVPLVVFAPPDFALSKILDTEDQLPLMSEKKIVECE